MLIDSHCHLNLMKSEDYAMDTAALVEEARIAGVEKLLCVGTNTQTSARAVAIAAEFDAVFATVGIHPSEQCDPEVDVETLAQWASDPKVLAIGETGLDYHYNTSELDKMRERFRVHIRAARRVKKPIVVHTRNARDDTIRILKSECAGEVVGVMHCFTETQAMAEAALALGFYISFSGIVTFKNAADLREVAANVPLERILLETDSPYLAPVPYRGKPNRPAYVIEVAKQIATLKGESIENVIRVTGENCERLFGFSQSR